ncbi:restriction endonuclease PLD domain-containing protein [Aliarcobacter lanthieri]|uniref:restriction endonuclease PLD domain-containing protein n=2 Tax=Aliarcobacter lanthieri TaxID=1355374 RepID=UPI003AAC5814
MFYSNDLESLIFNMHLHLPNVDELIIISGYVGPVPVSKLSRLPFYTKVYYGMYGEGGIGIALHNNLLHSQTIYQNIDIAYSSSGVHSKCYVWKYQGNIIHALIGSANFSRNGLTTPNREVLTVASPMAYNDLHSYINYVDSISNNCIDITVGQHQIRTNSLSNNIQNNLNICRMTLLDRSGNVPQASGINWGHGNGHVTLNDAYIAIRKEYIRNYQFLFPPKQIAPRINLNQGRQQRHNDIIEILWDDGVVMEGLLEGNQTENGLIYPKQISSFPNKNIMGNYLRQRLGLPQGSFVSYQDLQNYGRFDISVSLQGAGVYNFDFSV